MSAYRYTSLPLHIQGCTLVGSSINCLLKNLSIAHAQIGDALHRLGPSIREALSHPWHGITWHHDTEAMVLLSAAQQNSPTLGSLRRQQATRTYQIGINGQQAVADDSSSGILAWSCGCISEDVWGDGNTGSKTQLQVPVATMWRLKWGSGKQKNIFSSWPFLSVLATTRSLKCCHAETFNSAASPEVVR